MADGINVLTQLAQANAGGEAIGQVASLSGDVFVVRADGSEVKGVQGTEIFQGDVVRTGGEGEVGLVFADDTTFSLGEDGEMTIDEMVYDPGSESGSAAFSVAKGVFGFVSGQLAKVDPDAMVIDTPVATIGIRGSSGTGRAAPEGEESTFILVPDPDGTIGEIIIQTETGTVVMNVPYQVSAVLSSFISPTQPVELPASVVARVFGNTVEALAQARSAAGVDDTPPAAGSLDSVPAPTAEEAAAALAEAEAGPEEGTAEEVIAAAGESELNAALEVSAEEAAAEAAAAAAAEAALEGAASEPANEAAEAAEEAFDDALADGGSLVDAFRAAAQASEQKGAEVARQLEEAEQEVDSVFGAADPDSIDKGLDNLLTQSKEAQEKGRSSAEAEEHEQLDEQAQDAADEALVDDLTALAAIQARAQLASGFSRLLTEEELAAKKAAEAAEQKAANDAAAAEEARRIEAEKKAQETEVAETDDGPPPGPFGETDGDDTMITGTAGKDIIDARGGDDTVIVTAGGDTVTLGTGDDILKFTSWPVAGDGVVVTDYDSEGGARDKIVLSGLSLKSVNSGSANVVDTNGELEARTVATTSSSALDFSTSDATVINLTGGYTSDTPDFWLASDTDETTAVDNLLSIYGQGATKALTFSTDSSPGAGSGVEVLLFAYSGGSGNAGVFRFVDTNNDGNMDAGEVTLLAWLEGVSQGGLTLGDIHIADDPLIFDLDGDGVTLVGQNAGAVFDVDGDGVREKTGWMDSGDGMLVIDENGDGVINGMNEVVSSYLTYGGGKAAGKSSLDALAMFDDNGDGQIDSSDAVYSVLKLWSDTNGDGVTDEGELQTLAHHGITKIGLSGTKVNEAVDGGTINRAAEAEKANGEKVGVSEVSLVSGAEVPDPDLPPSVV